MATALDEVLRKLGLAPDSARSSPNAQGVDFDATAQPVVQAPTGPESSLLPDPFAGIRPPRIPPTIAASRQAGSAAPSAAPPPSVGAAAQPPAQFPPANPQEYTERVTGWEAFFNDPEVKAALFQFGVSMLQGGGGFFQNVGRSLGSAGEAVQRFQAQRTAEEERKRRAGLEERETVVKEREAGASERRAGAAEVQAQAALQRAKKLVQDSGLKLNNTLLNTALKETLEAQQDAKLFGQEFDFDAELLHAYTSALRARAGLPPRERGPGTEAAPGAEGTTTPPAQVLDPADQRLLERIRRAPSDEARRDIIRANRAAVERINQTLRGRSSGQE